MLDSYSNTLEAYENATLRLAASGNVSVAFLANISSLVNGEILRVDAVNLNWDFSGSLFFAFTITTAIGYGNYVCMATSTFTMSCDFLHCCRCLSSAVCQHVCLLRYL